MTTFNFEQLDVWRLSLDFAAGIYHRTNQFPQEEVYGLTSQLRRASASIAANIAEGKGRYSRKEFRNFLYMARGSLYEVITFIRLAHKLGYLDAESQNQSDHSAQAILSKLSGLIKSLSEPTARSPER
jgi:four helix bundle protein